MAAAAELASVVDEDDDDPTVRRNVVQKENGWDIDGQCAYRTTKIVRIRDRWLGFVYWGIVFLVMMYIIIFAFLIEGKHQLREPGVGIIMTHLSGKAFVGGRAFDITDIQHPSIDPSGAFVMTKRVMMQSQTQGKCVNWANPKPCPCSPAETCANGYCEVQGWCPSLNASQPPPGAVVESVQGLEQITLFLHAGISFASRDHMFVYGNSDGEEMDVDRQFQNITIGELLSVCDPPLKVADLIDTGALIGVSFLWSCDVRSPCEPSVVVKRLDSGQGYVRQDSHRSRTNGLVTRDAIFMYGIRIIVDSTGIGRTNSLVLIVIQIGSALALLSTASMTADWVMQSSLYPKDRRAAYYECKVKETRDYSDLKDRLNLVEEGKDENQATLLVGRSTSQQPLRGGTIVGGVRQRGR